MIKKRSANQFSNDGSLHQKTIKSGFWSFASRISTRGLDLVKLIIVARLLSPNDFGLLGIALLTMAIFQVFTQTGFKESIIQNKNNITAHLNTAWTTLILRGIIIYLIIFISAPFVATFFNEPRAELIIQVIGITIILEGLQNIAIVLLRKELEFQKQFILDLGRTLPSFILTVSLAIILKNVWALVYGSLIGGVGMLFISYLVHPYRPKLEFNKEKAKEMFTFGKWILFSSVIVFILTQGDDVFVGRILGVTALGFYQLAYQISNMPATEITQVISQVTFPAYSKIQDNIKGLRSAYLKVLKLTAFISFPVAGMIFVFAPDFVNIFLGEKWLPMVPAMYALVWWGIIRGLVGTMSPVFLAIGKPKIVTTMQFFQVILLIILIYPLTIHWNILGTSIAVLFSATIMFFIRNRILIKTIHFKTLEFYKPIIIPFILTIFSISLIIALKYVIADSFNILYFIFLIIIFILFFIILSSIADRVLNYKIKDLLIDNLKILKKK
jgi:lipopolysaccharide exporter